MQPRVAAARKDLKTSLALKMEAAETLRSLNAANPKDHKLRWAFVRILNELGAFHSNQDKNTEALRAYKEAHSVAEALPLTAGRTRLLTMGNYAQLLGRVDKIKSARRVASQAYEYAHQILKSKNDAKTIEDTANAELMFARLLRARPGAKRRKARKSLSMLKTDYRM